MGDDGIKVLKFVHIGAPPRPRDTKDWHRDNTALPRGPPVVQKEGQVRQIWEAAFQAVSSAPYHLVWRPALATLHGALEKNQLCTRDLCSSSRSVLGGVKGILCFQAKIQQKIVSKWNLSPGV